jgi:hypothetical protein
LFSGYSRKQIKESVVSLSHLYDLLYGGDVGMKLEVADTLFRLYGRELVENTRVADGMSSMHRLHQSLQEHMLQLGMDRTCSKCGFADSGGCCSIDIAAETDVPQLLLNMLAGIAVSFRTKIDGECCYLDENGCIFQFKPIFCLNYNCDRIRTSEQRDNLKILEYRTGMLLKAQHDMENCLIDFLRQRLPFVYEHIVSQEL